MAFICGWGVAGENSPEIIPARGGAGDVSFLFLWGRKKERAHKQGRSLRGERCSLLVICYMGRGGDAVLQKDLAKEEGKEHEENHTSPL